MFASAPPSAYRCTLPGDVTSVNSIRTLYERGNVKFRSSNVYVYWSLFDCRTFESTVSSNQLRQTYRWIRLVKGKDIIFVDFWIVYSGYVELWNDHNITILLNYDSLYSIFIPFTWDDEWESLRSLREIG